MTTEEKRLAFHAFVYDKKIPDYIAHPWDRYVAIQDYINNLTMFEYTELMFEFLDHLKETENAHEGSEQGSGDHQGFPEAQG